MKKLHSGSAADPENPAPTIGESAYLSQPSQNQNDDHSTREISPSQNLTDDHSTSGNRDLYPRLKYSILHNAALKGAWEDAKKLFDEDRLMLKAVITDGHETALHVATGASRALFVKEIIKLMQPESLALRDGNDNTAFTISVIAGNIEIATVLLERHPELLNIRDSKGMTPLHLAVLLGKEEMAEFLYGKSTESKANDYLTYEDRTELFFQSIRSDLYDFALKLLKYTSVLAVIRDGNDDTALHVLARKPSSIFKMKVVGNQKSKSTPALQLLNRLWDEAKQNFMRIKDQITTPSNLLFNAARLGNFLFLDELIRSYPNLVHELDEKRRTIFHVAILHRQINVFNLIKIIGYRKEIIAAYADEDGNSMLHLAAKYSIQSPESGLSSAALEMQNELIIFQDVEKLMQPSLREARNADGLTPQELFSKEHTHLQQSGALWMNTTANSCSLVATLIATVVFAAALTVPGSTDGRTGTPLLLKKTLFRVFAISNAIALSSSSFSILMFLSILTSGYTQSQFHRSLPLKLIIGLSTLFISIIFMMITFSSTYFLLYNNQSYFIPILIVAFVSIPITVFVRLQYPLMRDLFHLTRRSGFLSWSRCLSDK